LIEFALESRHLSLQLRPQYSREAKICLTPSARRQNCHAGANVYIIAFLRDHLQSLRFANAAVRVKHQHAGAFDIAKAFQRGLTVSPDVATRI
jgi:hypothetical protein